MEHFTKAFVIVSIIAMILVVFDTITTTSTNVELLLKNQTIQNQKESIKIIEEVVELASKQVAETIKPKTLHIDTDSDISKLRCEIEIIKQQIIVLCEKNKIEIPFEGELNETGRRNNAYTFE